MDTYSVMLADLSRIKIVAATATLAKKEAARLTGLRPIGAVPAGMRRRTDHTLHFRTPAPNASRPAPVKRSGS